MNSPRTATTTLRGDDRYRTSDRIEVLRRASDRRLHQSSDIRRVCARRRDPHAERLQTHPRSGIRQRDFRDGQRHLVSGMHQARAVLHAGRHDVPDLPISAFAGTCLADAQKALVEPYDVTAEGTTLINLYLVDDTTGDACGSSLTGHVVMPTAGLLSTTLGKFFAHEIGHVLLNPLGVDDSDNPDHLMHHPENHPETAGSRDGLFLSDCLGAHARALEDYSAFANTGAPTTPQVSSASCGPASVTTSWSLRRCRCSLRAL